MARNRSLLQMRDSDSDWGPKLGLLMGTPTPHPWFWLISATSSSFARLLPVAGLGTQLNPSLSKILDPPPPLPREKLNGYLRITNFVLNVSWMLQVGSSSSTRLRGRLCSLSTSPRLRSRRLWQRARPRRPRSGGHTHPCSRRRRPWGHHGRGRRREDVAGLLTLRGHRDTGLHPCRSSCPSVDGWRSLPGSTSSWSSLTNVGVAEASCDKPQWTIWVCHAFDMRFHP